MSHSATARSFLKLNSQFSTLCGFILLFAGGWVAAVLFQNPVNWAALGLRGLGGGLLGFAAVVFMVSKDKFVSRAVVNAIAALDVLWVLGSVVLVAFFGEVFTTQGLTVVALVALIVAFFAVSQFVAAKKIEKPVPVGRVELRNGTLFATVKRPVYAPTSIVWDVITDHPAYADVADNLSKVEVISGDGLGMKRRCYGLKGENWVETCDLFEPGRAYGFRIHTEAEDYPYPFKELSGRWTVKQHQNGSEFDIEIVAKLKGNALSTRLFATVAKSQFRNILIDLADVWAARMEREAKTMSSLERP